MTHTPSPVSVIGSTTEYTITCDVTVSCTGLCSDTITSFMEFEWKYHSFNSTYNSPFSISSSDTFTSTLTTVGDTSLSHAGQYQCTASLITV